MRATLNIPDDLISQVQEVSGERSKTKAIIVALQEFIKKKRRERLVALKGKVEFDYNWAKAEEAELRAQKEREKHLEK